MKIDVIVGIIVVLLNKEQVSCKELASRFTVSSRTIYRYVSVIESAGIPIVSKCGRSGGIKLFNKFCLNNLFLTTQEKMTLVTACSHINNLEMRKTIQDKLLAIK